MNSTEMFATWESMDAEQQALAMLKDGHVNEAGYYLGMAQGIREAAGLPPSDLEQYIEEELAKAAARDGGDS